jgi:hypothetical protein
MEMSALGKLLTSAVKWGRPAALDPYEEYQIRGQEWSIVSAMGLVYVSAFFEWLDQGPRLEALLRRCWPELLGDSFSLRRLLRGFALRRCPADTGASALRALLEALRLTSFTLGALMGANG